MAGRGLASPELQISPVVVSFKGCHPRVGGRVSVLVQCAVMGSPEAEVEVGEREVFCGRERNMQWPVGERRR